MSTTLHTDELLELTELRDGYIADCPINRWIIRDHRGTVISKRACPKKALGILRLLRRGWRTCEFAMKFQAIQNGGDELRRADAQRREAAHA